MIGLGAMLKQRVGDKWQPCYQLMDDRCPVLPNDDCSEAIDIMIVYTAGDGSVSTYPSDWVTSLQSFADYVHSNWTDYQLGLIEVSAAGSVTTRQPLQLNNHTLFKAAAASPSTPAYTEAKDINGGLDTAVNASGWRDTNASFIFLFGETLPGGDDDTYSKADEQELFDAATAGNNSAAEIKISAIEYQMSTGELDEEAERQNRTRIYREVAKLGEGSYTSDFGGGDPDTTMQTFLSNLCRYPLGQDINDHLKCCRRDVCELCLRFECTGEPTLRGKADWVPERARYEGDFTGGHTFILQFRKIADECYVIVWIDNVLEYQVLKCGPPDIECDDIRFDFPWDHLDSTTATPCSGTFYVETREHRRVYRVDRNGCTDWFCGTVDCVPDRWCLTISIDETCDSLATIVWNGEDECELGWKVVKWKSEEDFTCGFETYSAEFFLEREASTGNCEIRGEITRISDSYVIHMVGKEVTGAKDANIVWFFVDPDPDAGVIEANLDAQICNECPGIEIDCCTSRIPSTLYAHILSEALNPIMGADNCFCNDGTFALNYTESSILNGGGFVGWESSQIPWGCPDTSQDQSYIIFGLYCLSGVWTFQWGVFDSTDTDIWDGTLNNPTGPCDPVDLDFGGNHDMWLSNCQPGIVPHYQGVTVTE